MGGVKVGDGGIEASTICVGAVCANERERGPTVCRARLGIKTKGPAPLAVTPIASGEVSDATVALQGIKDSNAKLKNVKNVDESFTEDKSILLRPRWN